LKNFFGDSPRKKKSKRQSEKNQNRFRLTLCFLNHFKTQFSSLNCTVGIQITLSLPPYKAMPNGPSSESDFRLKWRFILNGVRDIVSINHSLCYRSHFCLG
jgi:hypothetical protein